MIRRPPRSTHCISSAASDVYKRQTQSTWGIATGSDLVATVSNTYGFIKISCPFGNYYSYTLASCTPCEVMTYQDRKDQDFCNPCPDGEYQDQLGQTECKPCSEFCLDCTLATNCFGCISHYYLFTEGSESYCKRKIFYSFSVYQQLREVHDGHGLFRVRRGLFLRLHRLGHDPVRDHVSRRLFPQPGY
eukprot:TRINITY_DN13000_c0_g2_i12.p1 TRINITY_DN13000_c0_g2~~TRINITY_DN13000_c0_g2_i12.p1  ORF type:complete len:198 (+),score=38.95 TRINITY_DN13000_c0_g2_i12:28-594(+)